MTLYEMKSELGRIIKLSSIEFQREMASLCFSPHIFSVLSSFLVEERSYSQKQLAAVGINYAVNHQISRNHKEGVYLWGEIVKHVLLSPKIDAFQWSILSILGKSIEIIITEFQQNMCAIINPLFKELTIKPKLLLYQSFLYTQTSQQMKCIFVRETIESFLSDSLNFICSHHDNPEEHKESDKMQNKMITVLSELMSALAKFSGSIAELMGKISLNTDIFLIIVEQLLYDPLNRDYSSLNKRDFSPERMGELLLFSEIQELNSSKSFSLKLLTCLLEQYDEKSGIEDFDQHKFLLFMENLTPMVIEKLTTLASDKKLREQNEQIIYSMLRFLERSCKFNFMLVNFENNLQKIYFQILVPLLETSEHEEELYRQSPNEFIRVAEELIELSDSCAHCVKFAVGKMLQEFARIIHGSLTFIVDNSIQTIRSILLNERSQKVEEAVQSYGFRPRIDTSFVLLSQFSSLYHLRAQFFQIFRTRLLAIDELFTLTHLDKARLLIFLAYNYELLFQPCPSEGHRFLMLADSALTAEYSLPYCGMMLFENCLNLGFGDDIWCNLVNRIETTQVSCVFSLINKIIDSMLDSLPLEKVTGLIQKVIQRLIRQFRQSSDDANGGSIHGSDQLYSCLNIITTIAGNKKYLNEQKQVITAIWPILDLFQFSESIEFEDNILVIYNNLLKADHKIEKAYFRFVPYFHKIYNKYNGFVHLLQTVTMLLVKGRDYFLSDSQGRQDLQILLIFIKQTYGVIKNQETLKHILIFYHYAYLQYGSVLSFDVPLYDKLLEIYEDQKKIMKGETIASIINFLLVSEYKFGHCNLSLIKQNRIQIFKGYQAKLFALNLRNIIDKSTDNDSILQYFRYSIRLIHYVTQVNLSGKPEAHRYYCPDFIELSSIDPFQQICLSLNSIKRSMQPCRYDAILQQLSSQISLGEIKDLLSRRIVDNSLRIIKRVRHSQ